MAIDVPVFDVFQRDCFYSDKNKRRTKVGQKISSSGHNLRTKGSESLQGS